ncbi:MAG: error-prone DNA polymerase [Gammaproteobacteria bacterium]|nr:error-prone DNA polymerase [Gammaproteobacteria bacterium]
MTLSLPGYAELHAVSNFTFLRGASHPEELVHRAGALGYAALALTDECSLAGVVRAHAAAKECGLKFIVGSELRLQDGLRLVLLATNRNGYAHLSALITQARRAAGKGEYRAQREMLAQGLPGCLALWLPGSPADIGDGRWLADTFAGSVWMAVEALHTGMERRRLPVLTRLAETLHMPMVACGDVHMHRRGRRALQDTLTAIRAKTTVAAAGTALHANGERHLRTRDKLLKLYPAELLAESVLIAGRCSFSLDELRYEYPAELVPAGRTPAAWLRHLTESGARQRWPQGVPAKVRAQVEHELTLIAELDYETYFLTVHDLVRFARERGILCQGRGSAANSAVCYCLGITEVDPSRLDLLFERFVSRERNEPPDIDVDFEHARREEVIQYIYGKYGRERAALAATVITYRLRSAVRDVGKALGLSLEQVDRLAKNLAWWDGRRVDEARLREAGLDPESPVVQRVVKLAAELAGFPRHLSQHVGGFVIARDLLCELVPIENAAMPERTVIQWDKDDLDALGLLKVDCLALGMLTAIHKAFDMLSVLRDRSYSMADIPAEDPDVYAMIQKADTVGVFQIESRAQMSMLPRLRPENFYDLVIEVSIVRPGPIQGDMVHPYLRRRQGLEAVDYPSEEVREVLTRTLGVPIFQEQVIKLAMVAAGFSPGEADRLRRSMAAWRRSGQLEQFERRLVEGMQRRGYSTEFAQRIFNQIRGFGEYGFPESHAASFALLVYVSAWLKCHEPATFTCALLNAQPMGFYSPSQLVQDARRHGVEVLPVDANQSFWESTLEPRAESQPALRLGFDRVKGFSEQGGRRLLEARARGPFKSTQDLLQRCHLRRNDMNSLANADALARLAGDRHQARWQLAGVEPALPLFAQFDQLSETADPVSLPTPSEGQQIIADYTHLGMTLRRHPLALLRPEFAHMLTAEALWRLNDGARAQAIGLVTCRQRPGTASGVIFLTLEDETGVINVVVWNRVAERYRRQLLGASLLGVSGHVQREGDVLHLIARRLHDYTAKLGGLTTASRNFH